MFPLSAWSKHTAVAPCAWTLPWSRQDTARYSRGVSWLLTSVVMTLLLVIAVLAVAAAASPQLAPLEPIARHGMTVAHAASGIVVAGAVIGLLKGHDPDALWITVGYAVAAVGVPALLLNRQPDESGEPAEPPHLYVVAVTAVTVLVLVLRLQQTW